MLSYSNPGPWRIVAVDATTPVKIFSATQKTPSRIGWRSTHRLAGNCYYAVVEPNGTAPTKAEMVTNGKADYICPTNATVDDGANGNNDVYAVMDAGTGNITCREIL